MKISYFNASLAILWLLPLANAAAEEKTYLLGLDVSLAAQRQSFAESSANMTSVSLTPYWANDHWELSLVLPYYYIEGSYYHQNIRPFVQNLCSRLLDLTELQRSFLIRRGWLTEERVDQCQDAQAQQETISSYASGVGDAIVSARYSLDLNQTGTWTGFAGVNYSFSSGDYDKGLGKGATETTISAGVFSSYGRLGTSFISRYSFVKAEESETDIQNFASASIASSYEAHKFLSVGLEYSFEQAYVSWLEDVQTLTAFIDMPIGGWQFHLFGKHYQEQEFYPEREFGLVISYGFR